MAEAGEKKGASEPKAGAFAWARKIDEAVFTVEKSIITFALITITIVVFVDVIARRITAPDSKIGRLLSRIVGIEDRATLEWVDANVAPWVTLALALLAIGFGFYSSRRFGRLAKKKPKAKEVALDFKREAGLAAMVAVLGVVAGYLFALGFRSLESWMVYGGTFAIATAGYIGYQLNRKQPGWKLRVGVVGAAGAVLVYFCLPLHGEDSISYVPEGYTWSKKISLVLLLWVGILSASICVYVGKHIRMGAAQKLVPEKVRRWLNASGYLGAAAFCALMTYMGFLYIVYPSASGDEFMTEIFTFGGTRYVFGFEGMIGRGGYLEGTEIPDWIGILSAPVGFGIASVRFVAAGISAFLGGTYGESAADEGMEEAEKLAKELEEAGEKMAKEEEE